MAVHSLNPTALLKSSAFNGESHSVCRVVGGGGPTFGEGINVVKWFPLFFFLKKKKRNHLKKKKKNSRNGLTEMPFSWEFTCQRAGSRNTKPFCCCPGKAGPQRPFRAPTPPSTPHWG